MNCGIPIAPAQEPRSRERGTPCCSNTSPATYSSESFCVMWPFQARVASTRNTSAPPVGDAEIALNP